MHGHSLNSVIIHPTTDSVNASLILSNHCNPPGGRLLMRNKHTQSSNNSFGPHVTIDIEKGATNFEKIVGHALHLKMNFNCN